MIAIPSLRPRIGHFPRDPLGAYLGTVALAGGLLLLIFALRGNARFFSTAPPEFWTLAGMVLIGELLTVKIRGYDEVPSSTPFAYALLLAYGPVPAVLTQAGASLVAEIKDRKPVLRVGFRIGQQALCLAVAGAVLSGLTDLPRDGFPPLHPFEVPGLFTAGGAYFVVYNLLTDVFPAAVGRESLPGLLRRDLGFQALTAAVFISLAPIILLTTRFDLAMSMLLVLPLIAIYKGGRDALISEHQALHDSLTGLPNRTLFRDRVQQAVTKGTRDGESIAVLFIDLDHFKDVNDTLGHRYGDALLRALAPRFQQTVRQSDTVARLGGDEFGLLLPDTTPAQASLVASKLLDGLKRPVRIERLSLQVAASIGIACCPAHGRDADVLLQRADVAMFEAKENRSGAELYSPSRDESSAERLVLAAELREAVEQSKLTLRYQPIVAIPSGEMAAVEALVRWQHPVKGTVSPDSFIPLAEHLGLIRTLTLGLVSQAAHQWRMWKRDGVDLSVALNISVRHLMSQDFASEMEALLAEAGLPPNRLKLEITESALMADPDQAAEVIRALSAIGIRIAIDDFGTGYSSLAYLNELPVHQLKIDRTFVGKMTTSTSAEIIVRSTVELAHNLGLEVVAEGVESEEALNGLARLGCDFAQGYHISRPVLGSRLSGRLPAGKDQIAPAAGPRA
jgi:diguanylate cyclase (GGDEF)-like protein